MRIIICLALTALLAAPLSLLAQEGEAAEQRMTPQVVERIVAVVGDSAIFFTDVLEYVLTLEATGNPVPAVGTPERDAFERQALDALVNESLIVQAAAQDTLVTAAAGARLDQLVEENWNTLVNRFNGSEAALRAALEEDGRTVAEYRAEMRKNIYSQLLRDRYLQLQQQEARPRPIDEADIRAFYEERRAQIEARPATVTFKQVLLTPVPSDSAKASAREQAEQILQELRDGGDFAELARRRSDDASGQQGGSVGWIRPGETVPEFDAMAFALPRGVISPVVETRFGAHILEVERIAAGERLVRHILIAAAPSPEDVNVTLARATAIRDSIMNGAPIDQFMAQNAEIGMPEEITLRMDGLDELPSVYGQVLRTASTGNVLGPLRFLAGANQEVVAVVQVTDQRPAGEYTYEDLRDFIRTQLQNQRFLDRLHDQLASRTYVDVRW